jgi:hypothetical protein
MGQMEPSEQPLKSIGLDQDCLISLADQHTMCVQSWLASRSPQAEHIPDEMIKISSTGLGVPLLNLALGCNIPVEASTSEIDQKIKSVIAYFKKQGVPWLWWIGPNSSPVEVDQHLKRNGILVEPRKLPAMIAPISAQESYPAANEHIKVWRATSVSDLKAASQIRRKAFRFPEGEAISYFEDMEADWLGLESPAKLFLAGFQRAAPAAIGAVIQGAGLPGIYIMATLPDQTRQGLGKAILAGLLDDILREYSADTMIVLTASRFGFPLYAQFGFRHLFDYAIYAP